jgi:hypothetical protein
MENPMIPARKPKERPNPALNKAGEPIHEAPFKPANPPKRGNHCTIEKFPKYKEDPPAEKKRIKYADGEEPEVPPGFRHTYNRRSSPSPTVACNVRNLKAQFPSAFNTSRSPVRL